jgi:hypothetical protein
VPYFIVGGAYLAIDLQINRRNYLVTESRYGWGSHAVVNGVDYVVGLYVGRHDMANYLLIAAVLAVLLLRGSRRVVFATGWLVLALLPFVFFRSANTSRYMYLPAMGFSLLLAEGISQVERLLTAQVSLTRRMAIITVVAAAMAGRLALFAASNVSRFADQTEEYRQYITLFKQIHGAPLPSHSRVAFDSRLRVEHKHTFLNALVQWEYRDPTIELLPEDARQTP